VVGIVGILVLLLLSAFFAFAEIAIFSLEDTRISALVDAGAAGAATLTELKDNPRRLLVAILVGNNIANMGRSSFDWAFRVLRQSG
jgi:putative hemolysin